MYRIFYKANSSASHIVAIFLLSLQEFHLSQTYQEGLLKLQSKEYDKARELLESVLKNPLISAAQVLLSSHENSSATLFDVFFSFLISFNCVFYYNVIVCYSGGW